MAIVFTCSIDDGHPSDMKMAELLDKHKLNATFFVPVINREGFDVMSHMQIREIGRQFEIGSHTYDHCYLKNVNVREAYYQITEGNKLLEDLLGKKISGFCYPGGQYRQRDVELVKACGFEYARTTVNLCFDTGCKPFEMPTTVQFYPHDRAVYFRNFAKAGNWLRRRDGLRLAMHHHDWINRLYALFEHGCERGGTFHLWGHSKDIDEVAAWRELDEFLGYVATRVATPDRLNNQQVAARYFSVPLTQAQVGT